MKRTLLLLAIFTLSFLNIKAQDSGEALTYLEQISDGQKDISEKLMRYISISAHSTNSSKIERKRQKLVKSTQKVRDHVQNADGFYDDSSLRDAMLDYYNLSYESLTNDYKEIAAMKDEANSDYEIMKALIAAEENTSEKLDNAQRKLEKQVDQFAEKYKINLIREESSLSGMINKSNEVTRYYNDIFLPMFKVNLQNIKLKQLLQSNDIEKIEEARVTTEQYAEEARKVINTMNDYAGDNSLVEAAKLRVDYYVEEANVMALNSIEYIKMSEELEQKKAQLEKLKPRKRTKELIDEFNALVDEANTLGQKLNQSADKFNFTSQKELMQWQELVQNFRKRHIPKYGLYDQDA